MTICLRPLRAIRAALVAVVAAAAPFAMAQSPTFSCPVRLELLSAISGTEGMDKPVYGLPVRQWTPDHLVQAQRQYDACLANAPGPQSLKDAERADAQRQFGLLRQALQQRDRLLGQQAREQGAQSAAAQSGGSVTQSSGTLKWDYTVQASGSASGRMNSITCDEVRKLPEDLLTLSQQSQQDFPRFYAACSQAQQIPPQSAALFRDSVSELAREREAQAGFIKTVQQAARESSQQTHQSLTALEKTNRFGASSDLAAQAATRQLSELRQQVDVRECTAHASQAGVPPDLRNALYIWRKQEPTGFIGLLCEAVRNGASFKFSPKGMVSKDSFEVAAPGKRAVQVTLARQPMSDGKTVALVPTESRIDGRTMTITQATLPQLTAALESVMGVK